MGGFIVGIWEAESLAGNLSGKTAAGTEWLPVTSMSLSTSDLDIEKALLRIRTNDLDSGYKLAESF